MYIYIYIYIYIWLVVSTPLKNMKVKWEYDIPNIWKNHPNVPNHQPDIAMLKNHFITFYPSLYGPFSWLLPIFCPGVQASCWSPHRLRRRPPSPWAGNGSLATSRRLWVHRQVAHGPELESPWEFHGKIHGKIGKYIYIYNMNKNEWEIYINKFDIVWWFY